MGVSNGPRFFSNATAKLQNKRKGFIEFQLVFNCILRRPSIEFAHYSHVGLIFFQRFDVNIGPIMELPIGGNYTVL